MKTVNEVPSELTFEELAERLQSDGWTSAHVEHLGGNIKGVRIDIPEYNFFHRRTFPAHHYLITDSLSDDQWWVGQYLNDQDHTEPQRHVYDGVVCVNDIHKALHNLEEETYKVTFA